MMNGINRIFASDEYKRTLKMQGVPCVFLSHQKEDKPSCKKIADYLMALGIQVYFDEYDSDLKIANQTKNPQAVTNAILKGIYNSTHMLCVVSPNTVKSQWVPFEVGFGYDKTNLASLILRGIPVGQLPDYLKSKPVIRDIFRIDQLISDILKQPIDVLKRNKGVLECYDTHHPLSMTMDSILIETYN